MRAIGQSRRSALLVLTALTVLIVAACGVLPRPFQPEDKAVPGVSLGARAGIVVRQVEELPPELSTALVGALVDALQTRGLPASAEFSNRASLVLSGQLEGDADEAIEWVLKGPEGALLTTKVARPKRTWLQTTDRDVTAIADRTAERIAARLEPVPVATTTTRRGELPPVMVHRVDGAPGDGARSLAEAMRIALAGSGVALVNEMKDDAFLVLGSVYVEPAGDDEEAVEIAWTVLRPDGARIGTVSQANTVPRGTLDGRWGTIARAIAQAGAPGVIAALRRGAFGRDG